MPDLPIVLEFLVFTVFLGVMKQLFFRWIGELVSQLIKKALIKSERDLAIWLHARNRSRRRRR